MYVFNKFVNKFWLVIIEKGDNLFSWSNLFLVE